ncbi:MULTISPECIES: universal stress protein [unclassified Streptomyces]|uniref:universal stress protein n=1 Tax=unclassified Streptomyces TaxID=2593676 RepID=UPI0004764F1C|nr:MULTISPECIES: universal stress protein [unclassified Streptomyces]MYX32856.1 universal stress protein [Streptomyces sp. SID8377]
MTLPLVVGTDGSDAALKAVDWAADEAAVRGVPLRIVYASLWERYEGRAPSFTREPPEGQILAQHIASSAEERARLRQPGLEMTAEVLTEDTQYALLREGNHATALVVGHRGRGDMAGLLLGSVSLTLAGRAQCPVVVVRGDREEQGTKDEQGWIVLGVGPDENSAAAIEFAFHEAELRGCGVRAVHAWRMPPGEGAEWTGYEDEAVKAHHRRAEEHLDQALRAAATARPGVRYRRYAGEGHARKVLLATLDDADLLVVGARRRNNPFGLQLGPVNHAMLHHAPCPVAVVPQPT